VTGHFLLGGRKRGAGKESYLDQQVGEKAKTLKPYNAEVQDCTGRNVESKKSGEISDGEARPLRKEIKESTGKKRGRH